MNASARHRTGWPLVVLAASCSLLAGSESRSSATSGRPEDSSSGLLAVSGVVVDAETRRPVPGALVEVAPERMEGRDKQASRKRQLSDASGRFAILDVPADVSLTIRASKSGYLDGTYASDPGAVVSQSGLKEGDWRSDVRLELRRPAVIAGSVVDETGRPVVDVWVRILAKVGLPGGSHLLHRGLTRTDDRGSFRFGGLAPGEFIIQVPSVQSATRPDRELGGQFVLVRHFPVPPPPADGRALTYQAAFFPGGRTPDLESAIELRFGEKRFGANITLVPVPAHRVSGVLVGPPGSWAGLPLRLIPEGGEAVGAGAVSATAFVGDDGRFAFVNVAEGAYTLEATRAYGTLKLKTSAAAFQEMEFEKSLGATDLSTVEWETNSTLPDLRFVATTIDSATPSYWAREKLVVGGSDIDVVVPMRAALTLAGRTVKEIVQDWPIPNVEPGAGLFLDPVGSPAVLGAQRTGQPGTDARPEFAIQGVLPGRYFLRSRNGWVIKSVSWKGTDYTERALEADVGQDLSGVEVVVTNAGAALKGTALTDHGLPGRRVVVILFPSSRVFQEKDLGLWPPQFQRVVASPTGDFEIAGLPAGDYRVIAIEDPDASLRLASEFVDTAASMATPVTLSWAATTRVNLVIRGRLP